MTTNHQRSSTFLWLAYLCLLLTAESGTLLCCGGLSALVRYLLVPTVDWERELNMNFATECKMGIDRVNNMCSFPLSDFSLVQNGVPVLSDGQPYSVSVDLHLPDCPRNQLSGMNIVRLELFDKNGDLIDVLKKSFTVPYRSTLVRLASRLLFLPLHLLHLVEEALHMTIELSHCYTNIGERSVVRGRIILESRDLVWSRALVRFNAKLGYLSHWLYYWPGISFIIMTAATFAIANALCLLMGCYQFLIGYKPSTSQPQAWPSGDNPKIPAPLTLESDMNTKPRAIEATNLPEPNPNIEKEHTTSVS